MKMLQQESSKQNQTRISSADDASTKILSYMQHTLEKYYKSIMKHFALSINYLKFLYL
jgi:hypothetical protein